MSAAEDETQDVEALFDALSEALMRAAKDGPFRTVDVSEYSEGRLEQLQDHHPDVEISRDYDDNPQTARYQIRHPDGSCPPRATLYLAIDEIDRSYGGPEEGGWWYDSGTVVAYEAVRVCYKPDGSAWIADGEVKFLRALAAEWQEGYEFGTSYRSSMRPRGEDYRWRVAESIPEDWSNYAPYC